MRSAWLKIGRVGKAHGLRGDFFVSDREDLIPSTYQHVIIGEMPQAGRKAKIEASRWQNERPLLKCDAANDRTAAEKLTGQSIWVSGAQVIVDAAAEYLWSDLEGRQVLDSDGLLVGRIERIYNAGASDVLEVSDPRDPNRIVGIPLIADFVTMDFASPASEIRLCVPAATFAELWTDKGG